MHSAIGEWVADQSEHTLAALGAGGSAWPWESTIRRLLSRVDADVLDSVIGAWMRTRTRGPARGWPAGDGYRAGTITAAGGDYVFTVKSNQPRLYAALKKLPWAQVPAVARQTQ